MRAGIVFSVLSIAGLAPLFSSCSSKPAVDDVNGANAGQQQQQVAVSDAVTNVLMIGGDSKSGYRLPAFEEKTLPNGLRILYIPDTSLPYITFSLMIQSGAAQDPVGQPGLSAFVAEMLDKGTVKRTAPQIAAQLGRMGADFDANASVDNSTVMASALSSHADALLANFAELVMQPAFSDPEIERVRRQIMAQIERRVDNPETYVETAFDQFLYENHPYARPVTGTLKSAASIKKKNIIQHYLRYYRPNNAILAVVGKFTPEFVKNVETTFGGWQRREVPVSPAAVVPSVKGIQVRVVDKSDLVQAQIRIGAPGIRRQNEDFLALRVANTILGGAFSSRLNDRIRKQLGLTYSISSYFDARKDIGPFEISTFTKNQSVGQTVAEALKLLGDFREKGVTGEEVEKAKGYLKGIFPTAIETPEKLAGNLMLLRFHGIPDLYLTNYLKDIDRLTVAEINRVIKKYIDDKNVKVLVYGRSAELLSQVQPLGSVEAKKPTEL